MGLLARMKKWIESPPVTADYRQTAGGSYPLHYQNRPPFTIMSADLMKFDPAVSFALALRDGPLGLGEIEVDSVNHEVAEFVQDQFQKIWSCESEKILRTKIYGYHGFEVVYEWDPDGRVEFKELIDLHPADTLPVTDKGKLIGINVRRVGSLATRADEQNREGKLPLRGAKALWCSFGGYSSTFFGRALLEYCYAPWFAKVSAHGGYDLRQLRMTKDAWVGDIIRYPMGRTFPLPDGNKVSARDIAREIQDQRYSGGAMTLPSDKNADGSYVFDYQAPTEVKGVTPILEYIDDLDWEIFYGCGVSREVVEAASSGSGFSGRSIPFIAFIMGLQTEFAGYVRQIDAQILKPLVQANFGKRLARYTVKPKKLIDSLSQRGGELPDPSMTAPVSQGAGAMFGGGPDRPRVAQFSDDVSPPGLVSEAIHKRVARLMDGVN